MNYLKRFLSSRVDTIFRRIKEGGQTDRCRGKTNMSQGLDRGRRNGVNTIIENSNNFC